MTHRAILCKVCGVIDFSLTASKRPKAVEFRKTNSYVCGSYARKFGLNSKIAFHNALSFGRPEAVTTLQKKASPKAMPK